MRQKEYAAFMIIAGVLFACWFVTAEKPQFDNRRDERNG